MWNVHFWPSNAAKDAPSTAAVLRGFFCDQGTPGLSWPQFGHSHFLPVIAELAAAVQAHHVGTDSCDRRGTTRTRPNRKRKTVTGMPTTEHSVHHFREHRDTSHGI